MPSIVARALLARRDGGPAFALAGEPYLADAQGQPLSQGEVAGTQARFLAVPVRNTGAEAFASGLVLEISEQGHAELARHQAFVRDSWTSDELLVTGQDVVGLGVSLAGLEVDEERTVYFPIDAADCVTGAAGVEFILCHADSGPEDPAIQSAIGVFQVEVPSSLREQLAGQVVSPPVLPSTQVREGTLARRDERRPHRSSQWSPAKVSEGTLAGRAEPGKAGEATVPAVVVARVQNSHGA